MKDVAIGKVYVEAKSGDLAVNLANVDGDIKHVVMFGSMAMVSEFASEHGLGKDFVREAMDVRTASPKISPNQSKREIAGEPYIDPLTDSLALDYRENGIKFTVVFGSAKEFEANAHQFGASEEIISIAYQMESLAHPGMQSQDQKSHADAVAIVKGRFSTVDVANVDSGRYAGMIVATTALHVVQDTGRSSAIIHDKRNLDKIPLAGEKVALSYKSGRAEVNVREVSKDRDLGRN
ncbi:hypothetical protein ACFQAT_28720 [Undibacterium arcticum]